MARAMARRRDQAVTSNQPRRLKVRLTWWPPSMRKSRRCPSLSGGSWMPSQRRCWRRAPSPARPTPVFREFPSFVTEIPANGGLFRLLNVSGCAIFNFVGENSVFWETRLGDAGINALHGRRGSALPSQCLNRRACNLPPATANLSDIDLEFDGRGRPDRRDFADRSAARGTAGISERCRKIILVSKAAIAGGVALLLFMMLGLFGSNQVAAIGSIAVVLGGIVSVGSNVGTLQQTMAAMSAAEALRSDLIGKIDLKVVGDRRPSNEF